MTETPENRLRRLKMRSWRRGTKEMDLLLGRFADMCLATLERDGLDAYEALLQENDQDLYIWVSGQAGLPEHHRAIIVEIRRFHDID